MSCAALPKVELHCHLDGVLDLQMVHAIRALDGQFPITAEQFAALPEVTNLETFRGWWSIIEPFRSLQAQKPLLREHVRRLRQANVVHAEVMISAGSVDSDAGKALEEWTDFRELADTLAADSLSLELLVCFRRGRSPEDVESLATRVLRLHRAGLVAGVALAGMEMMAPVRPYRRAFSRLREAGLGIEVHAGEWCGVESVRDALIHARPHRLGHGLAVFDDRKLVDTVLAQGIHLELCPTSNLRTGAVSCLEDHPIARARELGLSFSVNTDDPGPFRCTPSSELELLARTFGFDGEDFERIQSQAYAARFQSLGTVAPRRTG